MMMGIAQLIPNNWPNISFPQIAPSLAATRVIAMAVDLRWVGKTSTPDHVIHYTCCIKYFRISLLRQSKLLNPIVETAPKTQEITR